MVVLFIFHEVGASKTVLMARFLPGASCTIMPVFHIKAARKTHILICPILGDVRESRILLLKHRRNARVNKRICTRKCGGNIWYDCPSSCKGAARTSTSALATPPSSTSITLTAVILTLLVEHLGHLRNKVMSCSIGAKHHKLLHHLLMLLITHNLVDDKLLKRSINQKRVGIIGCCGLCWDVCA